MSIQLLRMFRKKAADEHVYSLQFISAFVRTYADVRTTGAPWRRNTICVAFSEPTDSTHS